MGGADIGATGTGAGWAGTDAVTRAGSGAAPKPVVGSTAGDGSGADGAGAGSGTDGAGAAKEA